MVKTQWIYTIWVWQIRSKSGYFFWGWSRFEVNGRFLSGDELVYSLQIHNALWISLSGFFVNILAFAGWFRDEVAVSNCVCKWYCDTMSRIYGLFNKGLFPLLEPSVPSLRSYGSMRSWCIHDGYEAFLTKRRSLPMADGVETVMWKRSWKFHPGEGLG